MMVLRTMWGKAVVVRIRARRVFVLGTVLASLLLIAVPRALALDPDRRISQYGHTVWRIQDGAIPPAASIAQTSDGYLWLGTSLGLMRFDGVRFMRWQPPQGQNLPGTHFSALLGSRDGSLWIGTTRGLARWKDGQLRTYTDLEHPAGISAITEDDSGTIWATRYGRYAREAPLCSISQDTLRCFGKKDGIPVGYGLGLTHDSEGNIWFGSSVLIRWRPGTPATTYFVEIAELAKGCAVVDVALGPSGAAWASLDGTGRQLGVRHYSGDKWTSYVIPGFDGTRVRSHALLVDRRGSLWVGTENDGVYRISGGVADHYGISDGLSGNTVTSFFEDREGNIWIVTDGGLDMFRETALISYTTRQGLSDSGLRSVMALRKGAVWIGTDGALNILGKQDGLTAISHRKFSSEEVGPMLEDRRGVVWLGTDRALKRFENGRFREIQAQGGQPFANFGGLSAIAEDSGGTVWVLTPKGQLFSIVGDKIEKRASPNYELGRQNYLVADPNGGVWLGAQNSTISYFRDGRLQTTSLSSPRGPVGINALFVDSDNSVLVASSEGLYRLNHGQVTLFGSDNGLPCPETFNAIRDNHGALWIYTRCGLARIAQPEWGKWIKSPHVAVSVMILDALDGAQAGTGSTKQPADSKAPDGRLWFVTGVSVQMLDPDCLYENALPPPVHIEDVIADRKAYSPQNRLRLPALTRDLEIDYTALSFVVPQKVHFQYKLEGYDRDWQDAGTRRQAFYSNLPPGNHTFRVMACNNSGVWNEAGASLEFSVLPALYQTNWFRSLWAVGFLALLWGIYQLRVQQLHRQFNIGLEVRVNERTRIARELHDTLLQNFHGLMFQFQAASNLMLRRPDEAKRSLDDAIDETKKALAESRDAIQELRSEPIAKGNLAELLISTSRELAEANANEHQPVFDLIEEGERRTLSPTVSNDICRTALELMRNAYQHAHARRIEAEIRHGDSMFRLRIRDDGQGIEPKVLKEGGRLGHWGLRGIRERADRIGARLEVWSEPGNGTEVQLLVPATIAYESFHDSYRAKLVQKVKSRAKRS
jgi:signal transduction histidine kinase/ligand-binding sensor domain-containing protein